MEKINPLEYIAQLEKENAELKKKTEIKLKHESEEASPKYWKLKEDYAKKMMNYKIMKGLEVFTAAFVLWLIFFAIAAAIIFPIAGVTHG